MRLRTLLEKVPAPSGLSAKARSSLVLGATLAVALILAIALTVLFGEILEAVTEEDGVAVWDRPVLDWVLGIRNPGLTAFVSWFSNTGGPLWQPIIAGFIILVLSWRWRDLTPLILTGLAAGGSLLITVVGKNVIGRARPPLADRSRRMRAP